MDQSHMDERDVDAILWPDSGYGKGTKAQDGMSLTSTDQEVGVIAELLKEQTKRDIQRAKRLLKSQENLETSMEHGVGVHSDEATTDR